MIKLEPSKKPGHYVLTDTDNGFVVVFEGGRFNETQKVTDIHGYNPDYFMEAAIALRQMGDWMAENHPELI